MSVRGSPEKATGLLFLAALFSKATGFLRVAALAAVLGASPESDALLTAFLVPEVLYLWFTEGGMTAALVRLFVHFPGGRTLARLRTGGLVAGFLLALALGLGAGPLVSWVAPGFDASTRALALRFLQLVSLYVPVTLLFFVLQAERNSRGVFLGPALGPLAFNLVLLGAAYQARESAHPGHLLAGAIAIGGLIQLLCALPSRPDPPPDSHPEPEPDPEPEPAPESPDPGGDRTPGIGRELLQLTLPTAALVGLLQLQMVFERFLLSNSAVGTITRFATARKLVNLPLGLVAVSLATALLPYLAQRAVGRDEAGVREGVVAGVEAIVWTMVPITVLTAALSLEAVNLAFGRGGFTPGDVFLTARMVEVAAPATVPLALSLFLVRGFLAVGDARTPARIRGVTVTLLLVLDFWLFPRFGPRCLFLNAALIGGIECLALFTLLPGAEPGKPWPLVAPLLRSLVPALGLFQVTRLLLPGDYARATLSQMGFSALGGLLAFAALGALVGAPGPARLFRELRELRSAGKTPISP